MDIVSRVNIALRRDRRKPDVGTIFYSYRMTSRVIYSAQYHRQHSALQAFKQFGALYRNNLDDTHPTRSGFETSTSEFRATTGPNKPSGPSKFFMRRESVIRNYSSIGGSSSSHYYPTNLNSLGHSISMCAARKYIGRRGTQTRCNRPDYPPTEVYPGIFWTIPGYNLESC